MIFKVENFKVSYMTWVAPKWEAAQLIEGARKYGYNGVELRVEAGHAHGLELDTPPETLARARSTFTQAGVEISCVATSLRFSMAEDSERAAAVEKLKAYVSFAQALGSPYLRVFGGQMPEGVEPAGVIDYISDSLGEGVEAAEDTSVTILIETHDSLSHTAYVREILKQVYSEKLGVLWDVAHPVRHLESIEDAFDNIAPHVRHVHVHDLSYLEGRTKYEAVALGEGFVPHDRAIGFLNHEGFQGHLSVELMNVDPDEVLPQYSEKLREYVAEVQPQEEDGETEVKVE